MKLKILATVIILFAILIPVFHNEKVSFADTGSESANPLGIIIPLYSYPDTDWQSVIQAKASYPSVPVVAVINPSNGPGYAIDPNFVFGIQELKAAGVVVLGYVPTTYGARSSSDVMNDIAAYSLMYQVNGIFFDEMANVPGYEAYYASLNGYAKSLGLSLTVGNPGSSVPSSYIGTVDNIVIYENSGLPASSYLASLGNQKSDFSVISYGNSFVNTSFLAASAPDIGYVFLTNWIMPSPYTSLPSYLSALFSGVNSSISGSPTISVQAVDLSGNPIQGIWTTLQNGGMTLGQGFTPVTFSAITGDQFAVSVGNFGNYVFDHWAGGSTSNTAMVMPNGPTTLVAYYRPSSISVSINAVDAAGNPISGLWLNVYFGGDLLLSGYTPLSFQGASGSTYTVSAFNYGQYMFSQWSTGSTNANLTITPQYSTAILADYV